MKTSSTSRSKKLASLFLFSIFAQMVFLLLLLPKSSRGIEASDYFAFYAPEARNMAHGHLLMNGKLPTRYPPGFPAFLAPQFWLSDHFHLDRIGVMKCFNVAVAAFTCLAVFWLAELIFDEKTAIASALLWAIYPFNLWLVKQPDSEVPFVLMFLLALWCFFRGLRPPSPSWWWFALSGVLLGLAGLVRPIALFIPLILASILAFHRFWPFSRRAALGLVLMASFVVTIFPWEMALKNYTGHFAPLSTGGPISIEDGLIFPTKVGNTRGHAWVPAGAEQLAYRIRQSGPAVLTAGGIAGVLVSELKREPKSVIELELLKMARSWYGADSMHHEGPIFVIQCFYLALALPGIWLAWGTFAEERFELSVLFAIILYFWGMTVLVLSILRYLVPIMPLLLMFAAVTVNAVLSYRSKRVPQSNPERMVHVAG